MENLKSIRDPRVQAVLSQSSAYKKFYRSPPAWEDQVLYFALPDRFSDNSEFGYRDVPGNIVHTGTTAPFRDEDANSAWDTEEGKHQWILAGRDFCGGTLQGIATKLGYLKRLGVSALWIAPVLQQVASLDTYHGYSIQNFLKVDERFGTAEDLKNLVDLAHQMDIFIVLDIIVNHCADVFTYESQKPDYDGEILPTKGFFDQDRQKNFLPLRKVDERIYPHAYPDAAIWPRELQTPETFVRKGHILNWESDPEYLLGDFIDNKKFNIGSDEDPDDFPPGPALVKLCDIYKFWMAYADLDGFRLDAVKHMGIGPTRYFVQEMKAHARRLGKHNFLIVGEIAGPDAYEIVTETGLDGALGIGGVQESLCRTASGLTSPRDYFDQFRNSKSPDPGCQQWLRNQIVTMIDEHDEIWEIGEKYRFCAQEDGPNLLHAALALNLCTMGIPCIYYGTEQNFDGNSVSVGPAGCMFRDSFIREAMFGGEFGAFRSTNRHFFNEDTLTFKVTQEILHLRKQHVALRRGDQYLREISIDGDSFAFPEHREKKLKSVIAWSRIYYRTEVVCAINTHSRRKLMAWVTIDADMHADGDELACLYPRGGPNARVQSCGQRRVVCLNVDPGTFVVYR